jgi:cytochrome c
MDSFELNKMAGALLATVFVLMSVRLASDAIFHTEIPEKPGFVIEAAEAGGGEEAAGGEVAAVEPIAPLLASADAAAGEAVFKKCASCHTVDSGGANKVGPNLYGIVGRGMGTHEGFNYSAALKEFGAGKSWDYEALSQFLQKPKAYIKGTAMGFAGVAKPDERANLIAYLRNQAATPVPLP